MSKPSTVHSALVPWEQVIADAPQILVGLSGGLDSVLLLTLLAEKVEPKRIQAVHVNHGLSEKADQWQAFAADCCRQLDVSFYSEKIQLVVAGEGVEAAARDARYSVFDRILEPNGILFLAHHADDQVETVLYRLLRGAGSRGLAGIPVSRPLGAGTVIRPLLDYPKSVLTSEANAKKLQWIEDESNADDRFDRNFIRNRVIPVVAERWPDCAQSVLRTAAFGQQADQLSRDLAVIDIKALDSRPERVGWSISIEAFTAFSVLRQKNILRYWSETHNLQAPSAKIISEILSSVLAARQDASPEVVWQAQCWARFQNRLYLLVYDNNQPHFDRSMNWDMKKCLLLADGSRLEAQLCSGKGLVATIDAIEVRYRQGGERCKPQGRGRSSSLKKLLLEYQLPPWLRDRVPLFYLQDQLVAVGDLWVCEGWNAKPNESGREIHWQVDSL